MVAALVQSKISALAADGLSITTTFDFAPINGNLLVGVAVSRNNDTHNWPSGWVLAAEIGFTINVGCAVAYKIAGASEPSAVTVSTSGGTAGGMGLAIAEFSGILTSPLDKTATANLPSSPGGTSLLGGPTATTVQVDELLIVGLGVREIGPDYSVGFSDSFTLDNALDTSGTVTRHVTTALGYRIVSATGAYQTTGSWINTRGASEVIATFKAAAAAGGFAHSQAVIIG